MRKVTPSAQGGVVREPLYVWMSDVLRTETTSVKSIPSEMSVLVPGVVIAEREDDSDWIMEAESLAETSNMSAMTASWLSSSTPWWTM